MADLAGLLVVSVELTAWRVSTPPGMWLRDWRPQGLPAPDSCGVPEARGAAACVYEEKHGAKRFNWRIWIPIGTVWPYRSAWAHTEEEAKAAADSALADLISALGARPVAPEEAR